MKLFLALPLLILAGCKTSAPGYVPVAPPEVAAVSLDSIKKPGDLMPLGAGNLWKYSLHDEQYDSRGKLVKSVDVGAQIDVESRWPDGTAVVVFRVGNNVVDRQAWTAKTDGLYSVEGGVEGTPIRPAMPLFVLPLAKGQRTQWRGKGPSIQGNSVPGTESIEVLAPQTVNLHSGAVSAIPISSEQNFGGVQTNSITLFQPGVGIVRLQQETKSKGSRETLLFTLLDHTVKPR